MSSTSGTPEALAVQEHQLAEAQAALAENEAQQREAETAVREAVAVSRHEAAERAEALCGCPPFTQGLHFGRSFERSSDPSRGSA